MVNGILTGYSSSSGDEEPVQSSPKELQKPIIVTQNAIPSHLGVSTFGARAVTIIPQVQPKRKNTIDRKERNKRAKNDDPESLDFAGPWAKDVDSSDEDEYREISQSEEEGEGDDAQDVHQDAPEAKTELFEDLEYMETPSDHISNTKNDLIDYSLPSKVRRTFKGHQGGVTSLEFFPRTGHLLLSCGNDGNIYLWDMCRQHKLLRGYYGHSQAVKCVVFNTTGSTFLSCSYDRTVLLWDTKTGAILKTLLLAAVPNTVIFNPNNENEILVGLANKRIEHFDLSQSSFQLPVQTYDHHLGAINSLTVVDGTKRFMSTSDDRTVRIWRWHINIPDKIIADPTQHSMPCTAVHPVDSFIALQTMDNSIKVIQGSGKFRYVKKKRFEGHRVAGYGIQIDCTPDGKIIMSGDANGFAFFWSWNLGKLLQKLKISKTYVSCIRKHPCHSTGVVAAGESGDIIYCQ